MIEWRPAAVGLLRGAAAVLTGVLLLQGCSSAPTRPQPAPLTLDPKLLTVRQIWQAEVGAREFWDSRVGAVTFPLVVGVAGHELALAAGDGQVAVVDARTGEARWRAALGQVLTAGVGFDGRVLAVATVGNELVALQDGRELWRQQLPAPAYTAPLVAGARVFALTADRSVSAYDGQTGRRIWTQTRSGEALVLRQPGVLMAVGDTLVAGLSGRLAGLNPLNGSTRWEAPLATPRGTNDVERLVDMVAGVAREQTSVCVRAFQAAVGCVDAARGTLQWSKPAAGANGLGGDAELVLGVEFDGTVQAWQRRDGQPVWRMEQLRYRGLSAPLMLGPALVVGDAGGLLHFLARKDGALLTRVETDGTAIAATPVLAGNTLVVVTRAGGVFGLRPE